MPAEAMMPPFSSFIFSLMLAGIVFVLFVRAKQY